MTKQIGTARKGLAVWEKTTMFGPDGSESFSSINEVVEISQATLEASLFEAPEGYREVKDFASLYSSTSTSTNDSEPSSTNVQTPETNVQTPASQQTSQPSSTEGGKKREGGDRRGLKSLKPKLPW